MAWLDPATRYTWLLELHSRWTFVTAQALRALPNPYESPTFNIPTRASRPHYGRYRPLLRYRCDIRRLFEGISELRAHLPPCIFVQQVVKRLMMMVGKYSLGDVHKKRTQLACSFRLYRSTTRFELPRTVRFITRDAPLGALFRIGAEESRPDPFGAASPSTAQGSAAEP